MTGHYKCVDTKLKIVFLLTSFALDWNKMMLFFAYIFMWYLTVDDIIWQ